jgi:hypothetical protein
MHSPEQAEAARESGRDRDERNSDDFSHTPDVQVQVAVTPLQHLLVRVARMMALPPTARELAVAADVDFPMTCAELKTLARLGIVEWGARVRVVREPDGLFFAPGCGTALRDEGPVAAPFCAGGQ